MTLEVRKDLGRYKPGEAPKVLVPKGGVLEFTYSVTLDTKLPANPALVVQNLLDAQAASGNGGRFRLETSEQIRHVIPTAIKNSEGRLIPQGSILDTIISLPAAERTVEQKVESVCAAISVATKIPVGIGAYPANLFRQRRDMQKAVNQRAKDVLVNLFASMGSEMNVSWQLFYDPGMKVYLLNMHLVSKH